MQNKADLKTLQKKSKSKRDEPLPALTLHVNRLRNIDVIICALPRI